MKPRAVRSRAPAGAVLAVVTLHLALLWLLAISPATRSTRETATPPARRVALRLIAAPPPPSPAPALAPVRIEPTRSHPAANPARTGQTPSGSRTAPSPSAAMAPLAREAEAAAAPPPAASAEQIPSLLDTQATRRAIRESARAPSLGDQLARSREEPDRVGAQERLAHGVKSAGRGDCLKGEYAGGGMGLLSLPFLAIAEARGDCAK